MSKLKKDSQLILRINRANRDAFIALCEAQNTSAAREIRNFISAYTSEHSQPENNLNLAKMEETSWQKQRKSKASKGKSKPERQKLKSKRQS